MATHPPPGPLDFLQGAPQPVDPAAPDPGAAEEAADRLPEAVVTQLMSLPGVDGVWVERAATGRVVVLHYTPGGSAPHLPATVEGMPVRVVGGEPIRAGF